jgi:hypothetical protein
LSQTLPFPKQKSSSAVAATTDYAAATPTVSRAVAAAKACRADSFNALLEEKVRRQAELRAVLAAVSDAEVDGSVHVEDVAPAAVAEGVVRGAAGRRKRRRERAARLAAAIAAAGEQSVVPGIGPVTEYQAVVVASACSGVMSHALVFGDFDEEED